MKIPRRPCIRCEELEPRLTPSTIVELVANIHQAGGDAANLTSAGSRAYFTATSPGLGNEFWSTDGTSQGTRLVYDVWPGPSGSFILDFELVGDRVFFPARSDSTGWDLWVSDGTSSGTTLVMAFSGDNGVSFAPEELTNVNGTLYFVKDSSPGGARLWKSDGTSSGTSLVIPASSPTGVSVLENVNGTLLFQANGNGLGHELWRSDGTVAGTYQIVDIDPGISGSNVKLLTNVGGIAYFSADDGTGNELWRSDGFFSGTYRIRDIRPGVNSSDPDLFTLFNGEVYFRANDGTNGFELWKTNGTPAGTGLVANIRAGNLSGFPQFLTPWNGRLYFSAGNSANGTELWRTDGTSAGTTLVTDINPGTGSASPGQFTIIQDSLLFYANDGAIGFELWRSDGTSAGTKLVRDILPGTATSNLDLLVNLNGTLLFTAANAAANRGLWTSDGTTSGTRLAAAIDAGSAWSEPQEITAVGDIVYFTANDGVSVRGLWRSDGTSSGTFQIKTASQTSTNYIASLRNVGGILMFIDDNQVHRINAAGTNSQLVNAAPSAGSNALSQFTVVNNLLFFSGNNNINGIELWRTDGTFSGTVMVRNIAPEGAGGAIQSATPRLLTNVNGTLYFLADDGSGFTPTSIWTSDGTSSGTKPLYGVTGSTNLGEFVQVGSKVFFHFENGLIGNELWITDGTSSGTRLVRDIAPGQPGSDPSNLIAYGNELIFTADDTGQNTEVWRSDGTSTGTYKLREIRTGNGNQNNSYATSFIPLNGLLYFSAHDGVTGSELWQTDGTSSGTRLVRDINPGFLGSSIGNFTPLGGLLYFTANTAANGLELWRTNGTSTGTLIVRDLAPGIAHGVTGALTVAGGNILFTGTDLITGMELWKLDPPPGVLSLTGFGANGRSIDLLATGTKTVSWSITSLQAVFSEPVTAAVSSLTLSGYDLPAVQAVAGSGTAKVTWTFAAPVEQLFAVTFAGTGPGAIAGSLGIRLDGNDDGFGGDSDVRTVRLLAGDHDSNGRIDAVDISLVRSLVVAGTFDTRADFDNDGDVDALDLTYVRLRTGRALPLLRLDLKIKLLAWDE